MKLHIRLYVKHSLGYILNHEGIIITPFSSVDVTYETPLGVYVDNLQRSWC